MSVLARSNSGFSALLEWARRFTDGYENIHISNFTTSWKDGLALCAILDRFHPEEINYKSLSSENAKENIVLAFNTAEKLGGVPQLLDPEDLYDISVPDSKSVSLYISELYKSYSKKVPVGEEDKEDEKLAEVLEKDRQEREAKEREEREERERKEREEREERERKEREEKERKEKEEKERREREREEKERAEKEREREEKEKKEREEKEKKEQAEKEKKNEEKEKEELEKERREKEREREARDEEERRQNLEKDRIEQIAAVQSIVDRFEPKKPVEKKPISKPPSKPLIKKDLKTELIDESKELPSLFAQFFNEVLIGFTAAFNGTKAVWNGLGKDLLISHIKTSCKLIGIALAVVYLISLLLYKFVMLTLYFPSFIFDTSSAEEVLTPFNVFYHLLFFVPIFVGAATNIFFEKGEEMFFLTLEKANKEEAKKLQSESKIPRNFRLKHFLIRIGKLALQALGIFLLSHTPLLHHFALPLAWALNTHRRFGRAGAIAFAVFFFLPIINNWSFFFLKVWLSTIEMAVELLDPYLARQNAAKEERLNVGACGYYLGFAFLWQFVLSLPLAGVFLLPIAQGAASYLYEPVNSSDVKKTD